MSELQIRKKDDSPFRFLIVDDSNFILKAMKVTIRLLGGEVVGEARDGEEAIEQFKKVRPDVVACDIIMPGMSGVDVLRQLIRTEPNVKVIMVSSLAHQGIVKEAMAAGAKHFLVKPFKPAEAARKIKAVLERVSEESDRPLERQY